MTLPFVSVRVTLVMSTTAQLVEVRLGGDLPGYLERSRAAGKSWRAISAEVRERTGLPISHEAVRNWHAEFCAQVAS